MNRYGDMVAVSPSNGKTNLSALAISAINSLAMVESFTSSFESLLKKSSACVVKFMIGKRVVSLKHCITIRSNGRYAGQLAIGSSNLNNFTYNVLVQLKFGEREEHGIRNFGYDVGVV